MSRIETLLSAASRLSRSLEFNLNKGGLITEPTELDHSTLQKQITTAQAELKQTGQYVIHYEDFYGEPWQGEATNNWTGHQGGHIKMKLKERFNKTRLTSDIQISLSSEEVQWLLQRLS